MVHRPWTDPGCNQIPPQEFSDHTTDVWEGSVTPTSSLYPLVAAPFLAACAAMAGDVSTDSPNAAKAQETGAIECSRDARAQYLSDARKQGLQVRGDGADGTVIARTPSQKDIAAQLYQKQLADLQACQSSTK